MVKLPDLVNAIAATLANIPELVAMLAPVDPIYAYVDLNPTANNVERATYDMQPGQLMVVWTDTRLERGQMSKWLHTVEIIVKAQPDQSHLDLIDAIVGGVPNPGDGMVWRNCPVMAGVLPTEIAAIGRRTDSENVDYAVIMTETLETGDYPYP